MLERIIGFPLARFAAVTAVLLALLGGCNRSDSSIYGFVDVVPSGVRQTACEAPASGELRLDGMQAGDLVSISAEELCHNWIVRKELPAGLYTVSWQPSGDPGHDDGTASEVRTAAPEAVIVNVFPEHTTTLRLSQLDPDPELLSQATCDAAAQLATW